MEQEEIINSGYLPDPRSLERKDEDEILGIDSRIELIHKAYFEEIYLPVGEPQSIPFVFDDASCVTHSYLHKIAFLLTNFYHRNLISESNKKFLEDEGYMHDGKVRFSTVFSSITNGSTNQGNYVQKVADCARNIGLIPYRDLPFQGKTWEQNHNPTLVTESNRAKARRFVNRFELLYARLPSDAKVGINEEEKSAIDYYQEYGFLQIGYPIPSKHALVQVKRRGDVVDILDTYEPFYKTKKVTAYPVEWYFFGYIKERPEVINIVPPLKRMIKVGMSGADVLVLQKNLRKLGYFTFPVDTGFFGLVTFESLKEFQFDNGIIQTGNYGDLTHAKLYKLLNK